MNQIGLGLADGPDIEDIDDIIGREQEIIDFLKNSALKTDGGLAKVLSTVLCPKHADGIGALADGNETDYTRENIVEHIEETMGKLLNIFLVGETTKSG
jgi:hypothetical protein